MENLNHLEPNLWPTINDVPTEAQQLFAVLAAGMQATHRVGPFDFETALFRGQSDASWGLTPSFLRPIADQWRSCSSTGDTSADDTHSGFSDDIPVEQQLVLMRGMMRSSVEETEKNLTSKFRTIAPRFLPQYLAHICGPFDDLTDDKKFHRMIELWSVMRHYGAPTRILDWSSSVLVALYFACCDSGNWHRDGAIWIADTHAAGANYGSHFGHLYFDDHPDWVRLYPATGAPKCTWFVPAGLADDRMLAQQGYFSICSHITVPHDWGLTEQGDGPTKHGRIIIPASAKPELLKLLHSCNINAMSLLPGLDGFATNLSQLHSLWALDTYPNAPADSEPIPASSDA